MNHLICDRRRFYPSEKGGTMWDHMTEEQISKAEEWENMWSEVFDNFFKDYRELKKKEDK